VVAEVDQEAVVATAEVVVAVGVEEGVEAEEEEAAVPLPASSFMEGLVLKTAPSQPA
jgi:hypothetical protein